MINAIHVTKALTIEPMIANISGIRCECLKHCMERQFESMFLVSQHFAYMKTVIFKRFYIFMYILDKDSLNWVTKCAK